MKLSDLSDLFDQAIAIDNEAERTAFVAALPLDEPSRQQLNGLIAGHLKANILVDEPEAAVRVARELQGQCATVYDAGPVREGQRLGNYKLLQRIGEGGMGYVFMADQVEPIQRRVAIKVIKTSSNSRQVLSRFEAERSALARLDHNNITRILDAGATDSGAPYFVMELVRGDSLTEYCDRHKLPIRDRVALLEQVCLAVHHAHQKGIIHRDIKPANIMITLHDGEPVPKVIDFGIAKALDRPLTEGTLFTRYGDMVGTPQYMSPEQAEKSGLDLDVRTDIYSLGAVLFELLTGTPPIEPTSLEGKGVLGVLETVRDNETESPSTRATRFMALDETVASQRSTDQHHLSRMIRGELDWIALKALARDRTLRYESAASMARDLRAFLDGGTVDAAAPSFTYQARKLFQRHRTIGFAVISCAALLLAMTLVSFSWAVSNNKLKQIATDRADELGIKTKRLEELNGELVVAMNRAQAAEKEALQLATEKKEQAALDRATRRHYHQAVTSSLAIPTSPLGSSELTVQADKSTRRSLELALSLHKAFSLAEGDSNSGNTMPRLSMSFHSGTGTIETKNGNDTSHARFLHGTKTTANALDGSSDTLGNTLKNPRVHISSLKFYTTIPKPNQMGSLLVEEYRREFGDDHPHVARVLVHTCRIGLLNKQMSGDVLEGRLREALGIVSDSTTSQDLITRISANTLLAETLHGAGRTLEGQQYFNAAQKILASLENSSSLEDEITATLSSDLERVNQLLSGKEVEQKTDPAE